MAFRFASMSANAASLSQGCVRLCSAIFFWEIDLCAASMIVEVKCSVQSSTEAVSMKDQSQDSSYEDNCAQSALL